MEAREVVPYYRYQNVYIIAINMWDIVQLSKDGYKPLYAPPTESPPFTLLYIAGIKAWIYYILYGGEFCNLPADILNKLCSIIMARYGCDLSEHIKSRHGFLKIVEKYNSDLIQYAKFLNTMLMLDGSALLRYSK